MKLLVLLCICLFSVSVCAKPKTCRQVKVGIIDTGFGFQGLGKGDPSLCAVGHKDFSKDQKYYVEPFVKSPIPVDFQSHGTNIAGIIESYGIEENVNFCIVILKYYNNNGWGFNNLEATVDALNYATALRLDFINYSSGGKDPSNKEREAIENYLNSGGTIVVAAGNDGMDLDNPANNYYPAKYKDKRIHVAGMLELDGNRATFSNYGSVVTDWAIGRSVPGYGIRLSGTSQAAAVTTGKLLLINKGCK